MKMAQQAVDRRNNKTEKKDELVEKLVHINRVAKTVKGGRTMSFAAVVVVGDQKGRVGYGTGKATEVPDAITKATNEAKKNMVRIPLREGRTLHHDIAGRFGAGKVYLRTAPAGTRGIAGGPRRGRTRRFPRDGAAPPRPELRLRHGVGAAGRPKRQGQQLRQLDGRFDRLRQHDAGGHRRQSGTLVQHPYPHR